MVEGFGPVAVGQSLAGEFFVDGANACVGVIFDGGDGFSEQCRGILFGYGW